MQIYFLKTELAEALDESIRRSGVWEGRGKNQELDDGRAIR